MKFTGAFMVCLLSVAALSGRLMADDTSPFTIGLIADANNFTLKLPPSIGSPAFGLPSDEPHGFSGVVGAGVDAKLGRQFVVGYSIGFPLLSKIEDSHAVFGPSGIDQPYSRISHVDPIHSVRAGVLLGGDSLEIGVMAKRYSLRLEQGVKLGGDRFPNRELSGSGWGLGAYANYSFLHLEAGRATIDFPFDSGHLEWISLGVRFPLF